METVAEPIQSVKTFVIRNWMWHFLVTCTFFVMVVVIARPHIAQLKGTHKDLLIILGSLLLCTVHTVLILILSMIRFSRKETKPGLIYLLHFFASAGLAFYTGWLFTGSVFENLF